MNEQFEAWWKTQDHHALLYRGNSKEFAFVVWKVMSAWQDIVSAPKDGTPVMLFSPEDGFGNVAGGLIWVSGGWRDTGGWRGDHGKTPPTHFQLLPFPPKDRA